MEIRHSRATARRGATRLNPELSRGAEGSGQSPLFGVSPSVLKFHAGIQPAGRLGFSLLELLVSMFILLLIMLACATMYQQAMRAWESGMDKTNQTLVGRGVVSVIAAELSQAIADTKPDPSQPVFMHPFDFRVQPDEVSFAKLAPAHSDEFSARRGVMRVTYRWESRPPPVIGHIQRRAEFFSDDYYATYTNVIPFATIAERVVDLRFTLPGSLADWDGTPSNLPAFIDIECDILPESDAVKRAKIGGGPWENNWRTFHQRVYLVHRDRYK